MRLRLAIIIASMSAAAALLSVAGLALASGSSSSQPISPVSAATALSAFREAPSATAAELAARANLRSEVVTPDTEGLPLGEADFAKARSTAVPGSEATAWIVPSGEDVCTIIFTPENTTAGPWSAGCESVETIDAGDGYTEATSPNSPTIVVDVTPDGAEGARVTNGQTSEVLTPKDNVTAVVLSRSDSVETPEGTISLKP